MLEEIQKITGNDIHLKTITEHSRGMMSLLNKDQKEQFIGYLLENVSSYFELKSYKESDLQNYIKTTKQKLSDFALQLRVGITDDKVFQFRNDLFRKDNINPDPNEDQAFLKKVIMGIYDEMFYSMIDILKELGATLDEKGLLYIFNEIKKIVFTTEFWSLMKDQMMNGGISFLSDHSGDDVVYRKTRQFVVVLGLKGIIQSSLKILLKKMTKGIIRANL